MIDVLAVFFELFNQAVVVLMRRVARRLITDEHDHGDAVRGGFLELRTDPFCGDDRRRALRRHRHRVVLTDVFHMRQKKIEPRLSKPA